MLFCIFIVSLLLPLLSLLKLVRCLAIFKKLDSYHWCTVSFSSLQVIDCVGSNKRFHDIQHERKLLEWDGVSMVECGLGCGLQLARDGLLDLVHAYASGDDTISWARIIM
ncbi:hypothetical protein K492DRAFT_43126 [Lichtheimia hyalospora FSU 10163]|nr:hypothetical protein K492DRAFT_43126 [Lichtheimia hyalospora FSU 10163]